MTKISDCVYTDLDLEDARAIIAKCAGSTAAMKMESLLETADSEICEEIHGRSQEDPDDEMFLAEYIARHRAAYDEEFTPLQLVRCRPQPKTKRREPLKISRIAAGEYQLSDGTLTYIDIVREGRRWIIISEYRDEPPLSAASLERAKEVAAAEARRLRPRSIAANRQDAAMAATARMYRRHSQTYPRQPKV